MAASKTDKVTESQSERFIKTARELECDEDEAAFDEKLRLIAEAKPAPKHKRPKRRMIEAGLKAGNTGEL